ncbi:hypothetical protein XENTR_v10011334 [Xenopus tropicalis]|nr:hypothetical protein XENTR_v10011334 [Xenopus tropicalis]
MELKTIPSNVIFQHVSLFGRTYCEHSSSIKLHIQPLFKKDKHYCSKCNNLASSCMYSISISQLTRLA